MKVFFVILPMLIAMSLLAYLNLWQIKNIDTGGQLLNKEMIKYLIFTGFLTFFFINPVIILTFRYGFSLFKKALAPQLIYQATPIISALIIAWFIFHEIPSKGTLAGTFFAILSVLCVMFWK